jgi:hypothetical protein
MHICSPVHLLRCPMAQMTFVCGAVWIYQDNKDEKKRKVLLCRLCGKSGKPRGLEIIDLRPSRPYPRPVPVNNYRVQHGSGTKPPAPDDKRQVSGCSLGSLRCYDGTVLISPCPFFRPSADPPRPQSDSETKDPTPPQGRRHRSFSH